MKIKQKELKKETGNSGCYKNIIMCFNDIAFISGNSSS